MKRHIPLGHVTTDFIDYRHMNDRLKLAHIVQNQVAVERLLEEVSSELVEKIKTLTARANKVGTEIESVIGRYSKQFKELTNKNASVSATETDLGELRPKGGILDYKTYQQAVPALVAIAGLMKNIQADLVSKDTSLLHDGLKKYIAPLKQIGIEVAKNEGSLSGYYFTNDDMPVKSLEAYGYKDNSYNEMISQIESLSELVSTSNTSIADAYRQIKRVVGSINKGLMVDKKLDDQKEHTKTIEYYLRILGRADFMIKVIYPGFITGIDNVINTYSNVVSLVTTGKGSRLDDKLFSSEKKDEEEPASTDDLGMGDDLSEEGTPVDTEEQTDDTEPTDDELDF